MGGDRGNTIRLRSMADDQITLVNFPQTLPQAYIPSKAPLPYGASAYTTAEGRKTPIQTELPVQDTGRMSPVVVWESCAGMWKGMAVVWPEILF